MSSRAVHLTLLALIPAALGACSVASARAGSGVAEPQLASEARTAAFPAGSGVVVMAHGGSAEWNDAVSAAVAPLKARVPLAVAFGMADPTTLQAALDSVVDQGAERVAVVRLFLSGESFLHQTEYLLGLRPDAPARPLLMAHGGHGRAHGDGGAVEFGPLRVPPELVLQRRGLSDHGLSWRIVEERAAELAGTPSEESVLILAHGAGDDAENEGLLVRMEGAVDAVRARGFRDAAAFALREDWPEARAAAEREIRTWVETRRAEGDRILVVPYRLSGFGPYASVLEGFEYAEGRGLLPHPLVARFVEETASELLAR